MVDRAGAVASRFGGADRPPPTRRRPGGRPAARPPGFQKVWDEWNAKAPDAQVADGLAVDGVLVGRLEALRGDQSARFRLWLGEVDVAGFATARLSEHAVHTWDVVVAVDPAATIADEAVEIIVAGLGRLVGFAAKAAGRTGRIHVTTTDPAHEYLLTLAEKSTLDPWDGGGATASLRLPAEAFVRLVYGRLDAGHTPTVDMDGIGLDELRQVFPGL